MAGSGLLPGLIAEKFAGMDPASPRPTGWHRELARSWAARLLESDIGEPEALAGFLSMPLGEIREIARGCHDLACILEGALALLRSMLRRPECPEGTTVPSWFSLANSKAMRQLIPAKPPVFNAGERIGSGVISSLRASADLYEDWWVEVQGKEGSKHAVARVFRGRLDWNGAFSHWDLLIDLAEARRMMPGAVHAVQGAPTQRRALVELMELVEGPRGPILLMDMEGLYPIANLCGGKRKASAKGIPMELKRMKEALGELDRLGNGSELTMESILVDGSGKPWLDPWRRIGRGTGGSREFSLAMLVARYLSGAGPWDGDGKVLAKFSMRYRATARHKEALFPKLRGLSAHQAGAVGKFAESCRKNDEIKRKLREIYREALTAGGLPRDGNRLNGEGGFDIDQWMGERLSGIKDGMSGVWIAGVRAKCLRLLDRNKFRNELATRLLHSEWFDETTASDARVEVIAREVAIAMKSGETPVAYLGADQQAGSLQAGRECRSIRQAMEEFLKEAENGEEELAAWDDDGNAPMQVRQHLPMMPIHLRERAREQYGRIRQEHRLREALVSRLMDCDWFCDRVSPRDQRVVDLVESVLRASPGLNPTGDREKATIDAVAAARKRCGPLDEMIGQYISEAEELGQELPNWNDPTVVPPALRSRIAGLTSGLVERIRSRYNSAAPRSRRRAVITKLLVFFLGETNQMLHVDENNPHVVKVFMDHDPDGFLDSRERRDALLNAKEVLRMRRILDDRKGQYSKGNVSLNGSLACLLNSLPGNVQKSELWNDNLASLVRTVLLNYSREFAGIQDELLGQVHLPELSRMFVMFREGFHLLNMEIQDKLVSELSQMHTNDQPRNRLLVWYSGLIENCRKYAAAHDGGDTLVASLSNPANNEPAVAVEFSWVPGAEADGVEATHGERLGFWISKRPLSYRQLRAINSFGPGWELFMSDNPRYHSLRQPRVGGTASAFWDEGDMGRLDEVARNNQVCAAKAIIWFLNFRSAHGESYGIQIDDGSMNPPKVDSKKFHFRLPSRKEWKMGMESGKMEFGNQDEWELTKPILNSFTNVCSRKHPDGKCIHQIQNWSSQFDNDESAVLSGLAYRLVAEPIAFPVTG